MAAKRSKRLQLQVPGPAVSGNDRFFDILLRHQIGLLRVAGGLGKEVKSILDKTERDLRRAIHDGLQRIESGLATPESLTRLQKLLNEIKQIRGSSFARVAKLFDKAMIDLAVSETKFMAAATQVSLPVVVNTKLPSPDLLKSIVRTKPFEGKTMKGWSKDIQRADLARIESQIKIGLVQGESIPQISRRIVGSARLKGVDGVTAITRRNAEAISRTSVNAIANQAKQEFYKANADIVKEELYVATLDGVTTMICKSLDGKRFPVGQGDVPPLHMNCRSLRIAVFDAEVLGHRPAKPVTQRGLLREFSRDQKVPPVTNRNGLPFGTKGQFDDFARRRTREMIGDVPAKTSYQQWLGRQSKAFQNDTLGVTKGRLFRDGDLKLDRFVNRAGDELTLRQLARREASAFTKAGLDPKDFL